MQGHLLKYLAHSKCLAKVFFHPSSDHLRCLNMFLTCESLGLLVCFVCLLLPAFKICESLPVKLGFYLLLKSQRNWQPRGHAFPAWLLRPLQGTLGLGQGRLPTTGQWPPAGSGQWGSAVTSSGQGAEGEVKEPVPRGPLRGVLDRCLAHPRTRRPAPHSPSRNSLSSRPSSAAHWCSCSWKPSATQRSTSLACSSSSNAWIMVFTC